MNNPFEYPAPRIYWPVTTLCATVVADQMEIVRNADAEKLRAIIAWPGTGTTIRKAAQSRLRRLERMVDV